MLSGFVAGALAGGALSYSVFHAFTWPLDDAVMLTLIRWSFILWALALGCIYAGGLAAYRLLRNASPLHNAAVFASLYLLLETALQFVTGHYYIGALAYSVDYLPLSMNLASLGGDALVSFLIAFTSALIGECIALPRARLPRVAAQGALLAAGIGAICIINTLYLQPRGAVRHVQVASIQDGARGESAFAHDYDGMLSFPALSKQLRNVAQNGSDLIIYPLAVANEVVYTGAAPANGYGNLKFVPRAALQSWMQANAPTSSTLVTWDITYSGGHYLQNYDFWRGGTLAAVYSKRDLYAFTEYTPTFAHFGFGPTPAPISPGNTGGVTPIDGLFVSDLQCSEIHLASLARSDAQEADLFLNIGLEWIFPGDLGEQYSLEAAQYRAAENNIPGIRATIEGPSALIDARGKIVASLPFNEQSVLHGTLDIPESHQRTLYSFAGSYPLYAGVAVLLAAAVYRRKVRSPGTRG